MDGVRHQVRDGGVHEAMPRQRALICKGLARDGDVEMSATFACARVPHMQRAIVANLEQARPQGVLQSLTQ